MFTNLRRVFENRSIALSLVAILFGYLFIWSDDIDSELFNLAIFWGLIIAAFLAHRYRTTWRDLLRYAEATDIYLRKKIRDESLIRGLGVVTRSLFYIAIGAWGIFITRDSNVSEIALGQLTLNMIGQAGLGALMLIGAVRLLFNFPEGDDSAEIYKHWGIGGAILAGVGILIFLLNQ